MHKGSHRSVYNRKYKQANYATVRGEDKYIDRTCTMSNNDLSKEFVMSWGNTRVCKILESKTQNSITNLISCV